MKILAPITMLRCVAIFLSRTLSALLLLFSIGIGVVATADDTDIYELVGCDTGEKYRFIFIVDNSGSMNQTEFTQSKSTIDSVISEVLGSGLSDVQVAVVQYGSNHSGPVHTYDVTVPFTTEVAQATRWSRAFGRDGTVNPSYIQDHQPASLAKMRLDGVYAAGGALDITDGTNVQFVFFTDAWKDSTAADTGAWCCSSLVANSSRFIRDAVLPGYGEYDALKSGAVLPGEIKAQFTLLHVARNIEDRRAAAAIASVGGDYAGALDANPDDPDGSTTLPRRYVGGSFSSSDTESIVSLIKKVIEEIRFPATFATPAVAVNPFNQSRHSDGLYYAFFQPSMYPRWQGNVKKYRLSDSGLVVDADNNPVLNPETGFIFETARSLWSSEPDSHLVGAGGFAARQPANRRWWTESEGNLNRITQPAQLSAAALGAENNAERDRIVRWARGADVLDENQDSSTSDPHHFVGDSLHSGPVIVNYGFKTDASGEKQSIDVLYSSNNLGVLHALDAKTGDELWSYTPQELLPNLKRVLDNETVGKVYGLDGELMVRYSTIPAEGGGTDLVKRRKSQLYMTERRGGNRIYALDISNGSKTNKPFSVEWKITGGQGQFVDLGQTWSRPQVVPMRVGCPEECRIQEVLLFAGGYNPLYDDVELSYPVRAAASGHGNAIYMVDPDTGELLWSAGNGYHHALNLPMNDSIPTAPVLVDTDVDGVINILYVTDIAGHVWRIDFDQWANSFEKLHIDGGNIAKLNPSGHRLRFFNDVELVLSGTTQYTSFLNVIVGSGINSSPKHTERSSGGTRVANRLYVVRDHAVYTTPVGTEKDPDTEKLIVDYRYFVEDENRRILQPEDFYDIDGAAETSDPDPNAFRYGYFRTMQGLGEKILRSTTTTSSTVSILSYLPPDEASDDSSCSYQLGVSLQYFLDLRTGRYLRTGLGGSEVYRSVGVGIVAGGFLLDTGSGDVGLQMGLSYQALEDVLGTGTSDAFRRFRRTGWIERDGMH